ncbi:MAG: succinate dehydrogenase, hydrophobic membrane anchor protein [Devosia sp.]
MIDKATISDPKTKYGHGGTREFIRQRVTGALNVLFTIFFVWFVVRLAGADRAEMVMVLHDHPFVGVGLVLLILNVCSHMRIGMHEVIEDYLYEGQNRLANVANNLFAITVAVVTILAIAKIMFWG